MTEADKATQQIRLEKKQFMGMRNAYKESSPFIDDLLKWKDKMKEVAEDSGLRPSYLIKTMLESINMFEDGYEDDDDDEVE